MGRVGRPKMKKSAKKTRVSISLSAETLALAESTGNVSHFFQTAVGTCRGLEAHLKAYRAGNMSLHDFMENVEDYVDIYSREFEESVPIEMTAITSPSGAIAKKARRASK